MFQVAKLDVVAIQISNPYLVNIRDAAENFLIPFMRFKKMPDTRY
jgi:hypothetical protein